MTSVIPGYRPSGASGAVSALSGYRAAGVPATAVDASARDRRQADTSMPYSYDPRPAVAVDTRKGVSMPWSYTPGAPVGVAVKNGMPQTASRDPLATSDVASGATAVSEMGGPYSVPTGVRSFASGHNDGRTWAEASADPVMAARGTRSMQRSRDNSLLQQARNVAHLNRYSTERARQFGPRYTTEVVGGNPTGNAVKFIKNAGVFADRHEKQLKYHSTIRELKSTAAVVNGMIALPAKNPLLQFSRAAMVGENRDVQYNARFSDVRAEVPSVFRQTEYPAQQHLLVDRAADSLSDKRQWLVYYDRVKTQGFHGRARGMNLGAGRVAASGRNEWPRARPRGSSGAAGTYVPSGPAYAASSTGLPRPFEMAMRPPSTAAAAVTPAGAPAAASS